MRPVAKRLSPGFTIIDVLLGFSVLAIVLLIFFLTTQRSLLLSETNKEIKIALLDAQSIVEEIQGTPIDTIMNPDSPPASIGPPQIPRYRHLQYVDPRRLFGTDLVTDPTGNTALPPHLKNEQVRVWYGQLADQIDPTKNSITVKTTYPNAVPLRGVGTPFGATLGPPSAILPNSTDRIPASNWPPAPTTTILYLQAAGSGTVLVDNALRNNVTVPLPIVPGSDAVTYLDLAGGPSPEQYHPSPAPFTTPDPLYVTVEVSWTGPGPAASSGQMAPTMFQRISFVRSR